MKLIVISLREVEAPGYSESRDALSHDWQNWLDAQGYLPVLVPNCVTDPERYLHLPGVAGLILSSGNDAVLRQGSVDDTSAYRDQTETKLVAEAVRTGLPVLGVCRGLHFLNIYFGGSLVSDVGGHLGKDAPHVACRHTVAFDDPLPAFCGVSKAETNSYHNQGITQEGLSKEMNAIGICQVDGLIEAVMHQHLPVLGIQWHPEREEPYRELDTKILRATLSKDIFHG